MKKEAKEKRIQNTINYDGKIRRITSKNIECKKEKRSNWYRHYASNDIKESRVECTITLRPLLILVEDDDDGDKHTLIVLSYVDSLIILYFGNMLR